MAGGLALAPLGITIWVFVELIDVTDQVIGLLPLGLQPKNLVGFEIPGLGVVLTLVVVILFGMTLRNYIGRRIVDFYEAILSRVPVLNGIYLGLKELFGSLFSSRGKHFRQVVLVEYPRRGVHCLAFLTNETESIRLVGEGSTDPLVSIFLPTTPNPTSGFYLMLPRSEVRSVSLGVDEAFKLIMSAGIVTPEGIRQAEAMLPLHGGDVGQVEQDDGLGG